MEQQLSFPLIDVLLIAAVIAAILAVFLLARRPKKIRIGKSHIDNREAVSVLALFHDDTKFFDFRIKETVSSAVISLHLCPDGCWDAPVPLERYAELEPGSYRLIVRCVGAVIDLYLCHCSDYSHVLHSTHAVPPELMEAFSSCAYISQFELTDGRAAPGAKKAVPLWVLIGTLTSTVTVTEEYQANACDAGLALILQFE